MQVSFKCRSIFPSSPSSSSSSASPVHAVCFTLSWTVRLQSNVKKEKEDSVNCDKWNALWKQIEVLQESNGTMKGRKDEVRDFTPLSPSRSFVSRLSFFLSSLVSFFRLFANGYYDCNRCSEPMTASDLRLIWSCFTRSKSWLKWKSVHLLLITRWRRWIVVHLALSN